MVFMKECIQAVDYANKHAKIKLLEDDSKFTNDFEEFMAFLE